MIKIFRKIRQNLLLENKTSKYFKYAIGEIVLVVIGILIAFQVSKWSTNKTKEKEAYNQLLEVQNEILNNILEFEYKGNYYYNKLRDVRSVFSDTLTFKDYKNKISLQRIMSSYSAVETQNEAFNKLIQNADDVPEIYRPLILEMKKLYNLSAFETSYTGLLDLSTRNFELIQDFAESLYRDKTDDYICFLLTDKDHKNRLARYSFTLDDIAPELVQKKYKALKIYRQMVALGFPDKNMKELDHMFITMNPENLKYFVGNYTNKNYTLSLQYNIEKNMLFGNWSSNRSGEKLEAMNVTVRDSITLHIGGEYLEFNNDKSMFNRLFSKTKSNYKRIFEGE
ncbi:MULTISPECIES: DUF6090 family protein [unclassified Polaribacter]|uniref:DUF6090 family protein n=1 Tax=unclassified Polaribacter TaxID=196858 RepID=UPI0011BF82BE|nr:MULTISPECIES: DUF6090 family protein [unclassified Polaribacter]TXD54375.1 hypothetical protein ES043_00550 [Polaribacter sp. IC063]TXD62794.1 hypothetical protein ES044_00210 [Polaribacter sp. IC066]